MTTTPETGEQLFERLDKLERERTQGEIRVSYSQSYCEPHPVEFFSTITLNGEIIFESTVGTEGLAAILKDGAYLAAMPEAMRLLREYRAALEALVMAKSMKADGRPEYPEAKNKAWELAYAALELNIIRGHHD